GNKRNNSPKTAAAAMNAALFHIGNNPSSTPEKMKPGSVARKLSAVRTAGVFGSVGAGADPAPVLASRRVSARVGFPRGISGEVSVTAFGSADGALPADVS